MLSIKLLTIGDELLDGRVTNTNQQYIGEQIHYIGGILSECVSLPDDLNVLTPAIQKRLTSADVLIISGGLGPTTDDLTRQVVANAVDKLLVLEKDAKEHIDSIFKRLDRPMTDNNLRQAYFPDGSILLSNPFGTAMGFYLICENCHLFCLPGVPKELKHMFQNNVLPIIQDKFNGQLNNISVDCYKCFGIGESSLAQQIEDISNKPSDVDVLYRAHFPELHVSIRYPKVLMEAASFQKWKVLFESQVNPWLFSTTSDDFVDTMHQFFINHNHKLVLAESCTGGLLSQLLTSKAGASDFLLSAVVCYSNQAKQDLCGVDSNIIETYGAVSDSCVRELAQGVLNACVDATIAISVTGIAGPDGGTEEKPVGTVFIAVATKKDVFVKKCLFVGSRYRIQMLSAYTALQLCKDVKS